MTTAPKKIDAHFLPLSERETLCRSLLAEFGVTSVRARDTELNHRCILPFGLHRNGDSSASASLNYDSLTFNCFVCGSGGLFWFIGVCRGSSTTEVRRWLADQTGTGADGFDLSMLLAQFDAIYNAERERPAPMPRMSPRALAPWNFIHPWLTTGAPDLGVPGRGIPEANLVSMQVGYAERYPLDETGRTSERIVIPHYWRGALVGWQTRRLDKRDGTPKYLNSPDFPKDQTIYNYDPARRRAVVVESPMSVLRHLHHLPVEGTFGASITPRQARLLAQHPEVVLWMDNDEAGWKAVAGRDEFWPSGRLKEHHPGLIEQLSPFCDVYVVDSEWYADPADMDDELADALVGGAVPGSLWSPPAALRCWTCKQVHGGKCADVAA